MVTSDGRRRALLIAASKYSDSKLNELAGTVDDIDALERVLSDDEIGDYAVTRVVDQGIHEVQLAIERFFRAAESDSLLLLYMSCHGWLSENRELHFAMLDTDLEYLDSTAIDADWVKKLMGRTRAQRVVLFLDCCHSGAFSRRALVAQGLNDDMDVGRLREDRGRGIVILTASNHLENAYIAQQLTETEHTRAGSIFTQALVDGLSTGAADRDANGLITIDELYKYVEDRVRQREPRQQPMSFGELAGDIVIAHNPQALALPSGVLPMLEDERPEWRVFAAGQLGEFLNRSEKSKASNAREALSRLAADPDGRVADAARAALEGRRVEARTTLEPGFRRDPGRYDVFLCYAREDSDFAADQLRAALNARGQAVWLDVDITGGATWRQRVKHGIEVCNALIFVISPDSVVSHACRQELDDAVALNKLIIPVVYREAPADQMPARLADLEWVFLREADPATGMDRLVEALETDLEWRDQHTRVAGRAREWLDSGRDSSYLLRGSDLRQAEEWLASQAGHRQAPTREQAEYISRGRTAASRRAYVLLSALIVGLVVVVGLAVLAFVRP